MKYEKLGQEIGKLVDAKQEAYGDSFGRSGNVLREMFPDGVPPDRLDDVLAMARVIDKLFRIARDPDAFGENPWADINGYSLLALARSSTKIDSPDKDLHDNDEAYLDEGEDAYRESSRPRSPLRQGFSARPTS